MRPQRRLQGATTFTILKGEPVRPVWRKFGIVCLPSIRRKDVQI